MKVIVIAITMLAALPAFLTACGGTGGGAPASAQSGNTADSAAKETIPLKDAKLNIEHNATDNDTGFQGFIDSEGWKRLHVTGPDGQVLSFEGRGALAKLGLTELFFETVEPANADVPIEEMLAKLPAGDYKIAGPSMENGESSGETSGTAWLTHDIPAGPELISPVEGATVPTTGLVARWGAVTETITGDPVNIIAYQLIIEKDEAPHPHMIGKFGLSIYVPASVTSMAIPDGFLQAGTAYKWEVLAIEESGNQTLSSGAFSTQ
ncbi:MAG: hypothetical protein ABIU97_10455 [Dehalococcoidia bacterium]